MSESDGASARSKSHIAPLDAPCTYQCAVHHRLPAIYAWFSASFGRVNQRIMNPFDLVQSFIEDCEGAATLSTLSGAFQRAVEDLGFSYFACGSHVDPLHPREAVMLLNYPKPWVKAYSEMQLHSIDPVFARAARSALPFFWDDPTFDSTVKARQRKMLDEARRFGIEHGYTIPVHSPRSPVPIHASCSVIPDGRSHHPHSYFAIQLMAGYLFESATRIMEVPQTNASVPTLSPRQRQCLELAGQGKTDWEIGVILGISQNTVHTHIESAKRRLNVTSRQTAIVCGLAWHQIAYGDAIRVARASPRLDSKNIARRPHPHRRSHLTC